MEDWIERVTVEAEELSLKIKKLDEFMLNSEEFSKLSDDQSGLLQAQMTLMSGYYSVLIARISLTLDLSGITSH